QRVSFGSVKSVVRFTLSPCDGSSGEQSEQTCDKGSSFSGSPVSAPLKTFCSSPNVLLLTASLAIGINQRKVGRRIVFLLQRNRVDGDKNLQCGGSLTGTLLLGVARRWNEEEYFVRHKSSVWQLLSRRIDDIAGSERDLCRCDFGHGDI